MAQTLTRILLIAIIVLYVTVLMCQCNGNTRQQQKIKNMNGTQSGTRNNSMNNGMISRDSNRAPNTDNSPNQKGSGRAAGPDKDGRRQDGAEKTVVTPREINNKKTATNPKNNSKTNTTSRASKPCQIKNKNALEKCMDDHLKNKATRKDIHSDKPFKPIKTTIVANKNWTSNGTSHQCNSDDRLSRPNDNSWDLACSSVCPWDYVIDQDEKRHPVNLTVARCNKDKKCGSAGTRCEEVFFNIPVLLQTKCKAPGHCVYEKKLQRIVVGCTCSFKSAEST